MIVAVFRYRLAPQANLAALETVHQQMYTLVRTIPGFLSVKEFAASDGEGVAIAEFASLASLNAWKDHPEHVRAQEQGREAFFAEYRIQVCEVMRVTEHPMRAGS